MVKISNKVAKRGTVAALTVTAATFGLTGVAAACAHDDGNYKQSWQSNDHDWMNQNKHEKKDDKKYGYDYNKHGDKKVAQVTPAAHHEDKDQNHGSNDWGHDSDYQQDWSHDQSKDWSHENTWGDSHDNNWGDSHDQSWGHEAQPASHDQSSGYDWSKHEEMKKQEEQKKHDEQKMHEQKMYEQQKHDEMMKHEEMKKQEAQKAYEAHWANKQHEQNSDEDHWANKDHDSWKDDCDDSENWGHDEHGDVNKDHEDENYGNKDHDGDWSSDSEVTNTNDVNVTTAVAQDGQTNSANTVTAVGVANGAAAALPAGQEMGTMPVMPGWNGDTDQESIVSNVTNVNVNNYIYQYANGEQTGSDHSWWGGTVSTNTANTATYVVVMN